MNLHASKFSFAIGLSGLLLLALFAVTSHAWAQTSIKYVVSWDVLDLSGGPFPISLASDPANVLGDSIEGYGFVDSVVSVSLSSQRPGTPGPPSLGEVCANEIPTLVEGGGRGVPIGCFDPLPDIDPSLLEGHLFSVDSFFDIFFDITFTDVDSRPGRDYAGMPDGASIILVDNGPLQVSVNYFATFSAVSGLYGLAPPPEVNSYFSPIFVEIPLGGDINGNGENDKVKIQLWTSSIADAGRDFIPGPGDSVLVSFTSSAVIEGLVADESSDPPFTIGFYLVSGQPDPASFAGPGLWNATLANGVVPVELMAFTVE